MENIIIDLKLRIIELERENLALKTKMTLMYSNWNYDYNRFNELKAKCRLSNNTIDETKEDDSEERREIIIDKLRMI